jgi:hypothetical protein
MLSPWPWVLYALSCADLAIAQSTLYQWTVDVTSQPPVPGKPFTLTWTGGQPSEVVYITLNNYFPPTPDQNIPYGSTDILCKKHIDYTTLVLTESSTLHKADIL